MQDVDKLSFLERNILSFCASKKIPKEELTAKFKNFTKDKRETALTHLLDYRFLNVLKVINPETGRPRKLYFITEKGTTFLQEFERWLEKN